MKTTPTLGLIAVGILSGAIPSQAQIFSSNSDLWDVSQGIIVTNFSPLNDNAGRGTGDARDAFGGQFGGYLPERGNTIFHDGLGGGFVHFLEWKTAAPVTIGSFNLFARGDGSPTPREFESFKLLAKSTGSSTFDLTLSTFS